MQEKFRAFLTIFKCVPGSVYAGFFMLVSTLLVWFPFLYDFQPVHLHLDGPIYAYIAKTGYQAFGWNPFDVPPEYFASHLPLYPILIKLVSFLTSGLYLPAMILVAVVASVMSAILFYQLLKKTQLTQYPLWTAFLFCFLPLRWLPNHAVGSTEPLFFCFVFLTFLAFYQNQTWLVILSIIGASLTRITGILLIPAFALTYFHQKDWRSLRWLPISLVGIIGTFTFYYFVYGNFWAYFGWNYNHQHFFRFKPFEVYLTYLSDPHGSEVLWGSYAIYAVGTLMLFKRRELFYYSLIFFIFNCFIYHNDNSRYMLASAPFAILVAFDSIFSRRAFWAAAPLIICLAYPYAWEFILLNTAGSHILLYIK